MVILGNDTLCSFEGEFLRIIGPIVARASRCVFGVRDHGLEARATANQPPGFRPASSDSYSPTYCRAVTSIAYSLTAIRRQFSDIAARSSGARRTRTIASRRAAVSPVGA